jgi:NADH-quinone oxidoreductase subunit D
MNKNQIPVGPFHPLLEEAEYFNITVEGETVTDIEMDIGWMHRGHEFISEQKTFTQSIFLVERICGICSTSHPIACVHAIEDIDNVEIPLRARYILHWSPNWSASTAICCGWVWPAILSVMTLCGCGRGNTANLFCKCLKSSLQSQSYGMMRVGGVARDVDVDKIAALSKYSIKSMRKWK